MSGRSIRSPRSIHSLILGQDHQFYIALVEFYVANLCAAAAAT